MPTERQIQRRIKNAVTRIYNAKPRRDYNSRPIAAFAEDTKQFVDDCFKDIPAENKELQFSVLKQLYDALVAKHTQVKEDPNRNTQKLENLSRAIGGLVPRFGPLIGSTIRVGKTRDIDDIAYMWCHFSRNGDNRQWPDVTRADFDAHQDLLLRRETDAYQTNRLAQGPINSLAPGTQTATALSRNSSSRSIGRSEAPRRLPPSQ